MEKSYSFKTSKSLVEKESTVEHESFDIESRIRLFLAVPLPTLMPYAYFRTSISKTSSEFGMIPQAGKPPAPYA